MNFYNKSDLDISKRIIYNWFNNNKGQDQTEDTIITLIILLIQNQISVLELVTENGYVELINFFVHTKNHRYLIYGILNTILGFVLIGNSSIVAMSLSIILALFSIFMYLCFSFD